MTIFLLLTVPACQHCRHRAKFFYPRKDENLAEVMDGREMAEWFSSSEHSLWHTTWHRQRYWQIY